MRKKHIDSQISKIEEVFGEIAKGFVVKGTAGASEKSGNIDLFVVHPSIVSTKNLFDEINLGVVEHNSWFLDIENAYDLVAIPEKSYVLLNVNVTTSVAPKDFCARDSESIVSLATIQKTFSCFGAKRPLTFHEILNLAFQYPNIFNKKIHGIQAYGSRFTKKGFRTPATDDTLEIYGKGNVRKRFLKLAREQYRYHEDTKIIPFVEV